MRHSGWTVLLVATCVGACTPIGGPPRPDAADAADAGDGFDGGNTSDAGDGSDAFDGGNTTDAGDVPDVGQGGDAGEGIDAGPADDAGEELDAGHVDDAGEDLDPADAGLPFDAAPLTWTYVPLADTRCANGTSTGIAVNLAPDTSELVLFLQGGGACWEGFACLDANEGRGTATHLTDTVGESVVLGEAQATNFLFRRADAANPWRDAHYAYVPYCTGDLYSGDREKAYQNVWGQFRTLHHKGARNMATIVAKLAEELPDLERILVAGVSAGGYGATMNWWRVREAFPDARVDVLADGSQMVPTNGGQYFTMQSSWNMQFPPGCTDCPTSPTAWLPYYATTVPAPARFATTLYTLDETIRFYFGYALDPVAFETRTRASITAMLDRQRAFLLTGGAHMMLLQAPLPTSPSGVALADWLRAFRDDDPAWAHVVP